MDDLRIMNKLNCRVLSSDCYEYLLCYYLNYPISRISPKRQQKDLSKPKLKALVIVSAKNQKSVMQSKTKKEPKKEESVSDDIANLKQAIDLMTECSRIIYIRWLQTKLAKELILIIARYKHRHWSMIIKEHENGSAVGLWLTAQRCLEIWGHLTTTKKKIYMDRDILRKLLCISHFYHFRSVTSYGFKRVTSTERDETDAYVSCILKDSKKNEMLQLQRYVQPELFVNADSKFNVCFECFLPLTEEQIVCESCKFVSFCNMDCLKESIEKSNGHACNDFLVLKYFPSPPTTVDDDFESDAQHPIPKL